ncbi:unnamed protein product, partial [marine sediment metagenome]
CDRSRDVPRGFIDSGIYLTQRSAPGGKIYEFHAG